MVIEMRLRDLDEIWQEVEEAADEMLQRARVAAVEFSEKLRGASLLGPYISKSEDPIALGAYLWFLYTLPEEIWEVITNEYS